MTKDKVTNILNEKTPMSVTEKDDPIVKAIADVGGNVYHPYGEILGLTEAKIKLLKAINEIDSKILKLRQVIDKFNKGDKTYKKGDK